jgi:hypothetical protein
LIQRQAECAAAAVHLARHWPEELMTTTCVMAWCLALLLLPVLLLAWLAETDRERARRWRRDGMTQQAIATRLNCSRYRVRKLLAT